MKTTRYYFTLPVRVYIDANNLDEALDGVESVISRMPPDCDPGEASCDDEESLAAIVAEDTERNVHENT